MEEKNLLAMNLQFFSEDEGESADVNEAEAVDQPEGEAEAETQETEGVTEEETAAPQFQSDKANAAFAEMRAMMLYIPSTSCKLIPSLQ